MKARLTASFGVPYNYSGISYPQTGFPDQVADIKRRVDAQLGYESNNCLINLYESGDQTLGFHADSIVNLVETSRIAIVSLGATRTMIFRSKADRSYRFGYVLSAGSILIMTLDTQKYWEHGINVEVGELPRIGLTFRRFREP